MTWEGIDVSDFDNLLTPTLLAGQDFVIIRAGDGGHTNWTDDHWDANVAVAKKAGILWGAYWRATTGQITQQAEAFYQLVGDPAGKLMVLDWEGPTIPTTSEATTFIAYLHTKGVDSVGLYSSIDQWKMLGQDWNWIAHPGSPPTIPHDLWQYKAVPGVADYNHAYTDPSTLVAGGTMTDDEIAKALTRIFGIANVDSLEPIFQSAGAVKDLAAGDTPTNPDRLAALNALLSLTGSAGPPGPPGPQGPKGDPGTLVPGTVFEATVG